MNFFVIGLPRSRTAWLSAFLSQDRLCFHEGFNGCYTLEEYKAKLGEHNGDSSTGLMLLDMNKEFPDSPKVIINSNVEKAIDYAYKVYNYYDPEYFKYMDKRLKSIEGLHINFDYMDDHLEEIWNHLLDTPFNNKRAEIFKRLRIEIKDPFDFDFESMRSLMGIQNAIPPSKLDG